MRRIAFCITDLDPGGAERALVQLASGLHRRGWEAKVFCLGPRGALAAPLEEAGVPVECLNATSRWSWGVVGRLRKALRDYRPAVLQTFLFHANIAGRVAAWRARVPVVVSGLRVAERDSPWRMRLDRWTQPLVSMNVCVSHGVKEFSIDEVGLPAAKVTVILNGVDFAHFAEAAPADPSAFGIPAGARVLTFVGRLHPQKGADLLIEAVMPLLEQYTDLHLLLLGDGPQRVELEAQAAKTSAPERIRIVGHQPDVAGILKASTALVSPSRWEGMPNVVLEAMSAGCPVIGTDVEGTRELITSGVTGWLAPPENAVELRRIVEQFLNSATASRLASAAQDVVRKRFTWDGSCEAYEQLYESLGVL